MTIAVHIISRPQFDIEATIRFLSGNAVTWNRTPNSTQPEEICEIAGRVCYMSFGEKQSPRNNAQYIQNLVEMGHESVLEHVSWTFIIEGVSRAFTHELVRHRVGFAFSQLSQQYHDESQANAVEPSILAKVPKLHKEWLEAIQGSQKTYRNLLNNLKELESEPIEGFTPKEVKRMIHSAARSILPNATETKIVVTANARALRHFFKLRGTIVGDEEMRRVSAKLLELIKVEAPSLFFDFSIGSLPDGVPIVIHPQST